MSRPLASFARAAAVCGILAVSISPTLVAQKAAPKIGGSWTLDTVLSDPPPRPQDGGAMGGGMGGGGMGGGRGMGGGMGAGMGGGMGGGMGMGGGRGRGMGGGGNGQGGGAGGGNDPAARAAMMEMIRPAKGLLIVQEDAMITFRDDAGNTRTIVPDGKPSQEYFESGEATTVAKWHDSKLEIKREVPHGPTLQQAYSIDGRTGDLLLWTKVEGGASGRSIEIKRVYTPAPQPN